MQFGGGRCKTAQSACTGFQCFVQRVEEITRSVHRGCHGILLNNPPYFSFAVRNSIRSAPLLTIERQDPPLQCKTDQIRLGSQMKFSHQITMMHFHRSGTDRQTGRDGCVVQTLSRQMQYFSFVSVHTNLWN